METVKFAGYKNVGDHLDDQCRVSVLGMTMRRNVKPQNYCYSHSMYVNTCLACGQQFHTGHIHKKTCSAKCRKHLSRSKV